MYPSSRKPADCCAIGQTNGHCVGLKFQNYSCPDMIIANSFTQARIRKMKIYPKICVKLGMLGPKRRQFRHPTTRKFALSYLKYQLYQKQHKCLWNHTNKIFPIRNFTRSWYNFTQALLVVLVTNIMSVILPSEIIAWTLLLWNRNSIFGFTQKCQKKGH